MDKIQSNKMQNAIDCNQGHSRKRGCFSLFELQTAYPLIATVKLKCF
jgi:hypothetical protein